MRTAVYNRYWATGGGAEKYGGVIAEILSADGPLDLLTHDAVDLDWLADRLRIDLSRVDVRVIEDASGSVTDASPDYDLFVNVSYMSGEPVATRHSLYVVHFPTPLDGHLPAYQRMIARGFDRLRNPQGTTMEWGKGFYPRERGGRGVAWTNGDGHVRLVTPPGQRVPVSFVFGHLRPLGLGPATVRVEVEGEVEAEVSVSPPHSRLDGRRGVVASLEVESRAEGVPVDVRILSDSFVPADVVGGDDRRRLGVPVTSVHVGSGPTAYLGRWFPLLLSAPASAGWTSSYGALIANSEFTRRWIGRYWDCDSEVLYPPVTMHAGGDKRPAILSVGRFFAADQGHSKKQLELTRAFRRLCDTGTRGWTLHLAGGCGEGRRYLEQVRHEASGYPVEFHANASGEALEALYASASIYWHAAGLGEHPERDPDRLEHFGITTAEAMSAGAVPVVIGMAGQLETVRHGVDGFHFRTLDGLCSMTEVLIGDGKLWAQMSSSAARRAQRFSVDAFADRLHDLVDRVRA